jgi:hypothetical protein
MMHDPRLPEADIVQCFDYLLVAEHDFVIENHIQLFKHSCISLLDFLLKIMLLFSAFVSGCGTLRKEH